MLFLIYIEGGVPVDRRVARTRRNIFYAFFRLVQTKPISEITVSELARHADIDRKTFYLHFQTVEDVYREFVQTIYTQVSEILTEAEERGQEHQKRIESGETLERPADVAPFDFVWFYDSLNRIMVENLAFFEKLSRDTTFMFLKNDFKNVLKQALMDHDSSLGDYQRSLYAEFIAAGAISLWTDWLQNKQVPLDQFRDSAIEVLREAWNMRGCRKTIAVNITDRVIPCDT